MVATLSAMRRLIVLIAAGALVGGTVPAGAAKGVAFPDGEWSGSAIWTGAISKKNVFASGNGKVKFTLAVDGGDVASGRMTMTGTGQSKVAGGSGKLDLSASLNLGGTAERVTANGSLSYVGTVTVEGFGTRPVSGRVAGSTGSFSPTFVSCNRVTGDLATEGRKVQQAAGFTTTVTAKFVALRVGDGTSEAVTRYKQVADQIISALDSIRAGTPPSVQMLVELVEQVQALNSLVHDSSPCPNVPAGFKAGFSDSLLVELFNELMREVLAKHEGRFTVHELLQLMVLTLRIGLTEPTEDAFLDVLVARVEALTNELTQQVGDDPYEFWPKELMAIYEIYTTALHWGLTDLAAVAKRALGNFVEVVGGEEEPVEV